MRGTRGGTPRRPPCGSGTIPIEPAVITKHMAPGRIATSSR
ncbi:MAG: hypothetical protein IT361_01800 [Gemmatimonadaceae bacterium]|nr:hypothetical protein [Gemmatimonadaceae bacterium]